MRATLLVIDGQNDFLEGGELPVPGGRADMDRVAALIRDAGPQLERIVLTLDQHSVEDISHPMWWTDASGCHPPPFTTMQVHYRTESDGPHAYVQGTLPDGTLQEYSPRILAYTTWYLAQTSQRRGLPHMIWPEHCLVGTHGACLYEGLSDAVHHWVRTVRPLVPWASPYQNVEYVYKGANPYTEHFSAVRAVVPLTEDPNTQDNSRLLSMLTDSSVVLVAGEARSHCVADTIRDLNVIPGLIEKIILLTDGTSDVPGFEGEGEAFVIEMVAKGMRTMTCQEAVHELLSQGEFGMSRSGLGEPWTATPPEPAEGHK
jgi:nicotinamidase/pyrazinamidase